MQRASVESSLIVASIPLYENETFPHLRPLSIPNHPGDVPRFTKNSILTQLDEDITAWHEWLTEEERKNGGGGKNGHG